MDRNKVVQRIADGDISDLAGVDLSGADLRGLDLSNGDFSGANLSRADLTGARLEGTKLKGANLSHAVLRDAYIGAGVRGADLTHADLTGATLTFVFLADVNNARADLTGATMPNGTTYQHPSTGAMSYGLAEIMEQGRRETEKKAVSKAQRKPSRDVKIESGLPANSNSSKNAALGWIVIGALLITGFAALGYGFAEYPLVPMTCVIMALGLGIKRLRRGNFGRGWFTATAIVGLVMTLGAIGVNANDATSDTSGGGTLMLVPAVLALVARIRGRDLES